MWGRSRAFRSIYKIKIHSTVGVSAMAKKLSVGLKSGSIDSSAAMYELALAWELTTGVLGSTRISNTLPISVYTTGMSSSLLRRDHPSRCAESCYIRASAALQVVTPDLRRTNICHTILYPTTYTCYPNSTSWSTASEGLEEHVDTQTFWACPSTRDYNGKDTLLG